MKKRNFVTALVADSAGEIFELDGYAGVGMAGKTLFPLSVKNTVNMPFGGELMFLPDRRPILFNMASGKMETLRENPFEPGEPLFPVAAFNSPGWVISGVSAYEETESAGHLPLFSYGAVGWRGEGFRSPLIQVDKEPRQDLRRMKPGDVAAGVERMRKRLPGNRLRKHLETCALTYGCPAGKNFFLGRYEAPLPTSKHCNARCRGCLSMQKGGEIPHSQDRIGFTPTPDEIAGVALAHIRKTRAAVVSFGQGCEGDPLLASEVIEPAIRKIRSATDFGTINMNTNGSLPDRMGPLLDAGLDSIRISINSMREPCWRAYFRPMGHGFEDVEKSVDMALARGKFVSVNYLNLPGFTDSPEETEALLAFIEKHPIHMIQWRNLNFDPIRYFKIMEAAAPAGPPIGTRNLLNRIRKRFPELKYGYFNPPREKMGDLRGAERSSRRGRG